MTDFVEFDPEAHGSPTQRLTVRAATSADVDALALVMSARGGTPDEYIDTARRFIERLPVLFLAESEENEPIGWSGAQRHPILPDGDPTWLVSGLTVVPSWRRRGIAIALLRQVTSAVAAIDPYAPLHSVINVRNLASIALHKRAGFAEIDRGPTFAGITFTGGFGVLLERASTAALP